MPTALIGKQPLSMLAALLIRGVLAARIGLAADSHSCRDQREPASARGFQPIRGSRPGIDIPAFTITRGGDDASPQQVISLGNTKWAQEILRPMSVVSQSETTTTKQHNTFTELTPDADTRVYGCYEPARGFYVFRWKKRKKGYGFLSYHCHIPVRHCLT